MSYEETIALEQVPYNDLSPCIVDDEEIVARVLFSPKHYLDGEILPTAFQQIFSSDGMSILRKSHFFEESLSKTINQLETTEAKYSGYVCAKVEDIRNIKVNNLRVFYILDTATKEKLGHADIFYIKLSYEECGLPKKVFNGYIRSEIAEVFNQLIAIK